MLYTYTEHVFTLNLSTISALPLYNGASCSSDPHHILRRWTASTGEEMRNIHWTYDWDSKAAYSVQVRLRLRIKSDLINVTHQLSLWVNHEYVSMQCITVPSNLEANFEIKSICQYQHFFCIFREKLAEQEEFAKQELIRKARKAAAIQMDKYQGMYWSYIVCRFCLESEITNTSRVFESPSY